MSVCPPLQRGHTNNLANVTISAQASHATGGVSLTHPAPSEVRALHTHKASLMLGGSGPSVQDPGPRGWPGWSGSLAEGASEGLPPRTPTSLPTAATLVQPLSLQPLTANSNRWWFAMESTALRLQRLRSSAFLRRGWGHLWLSCAVPACESYPRALSPLEVPLVFPSDCRRSPDLRPHCSSLPAQ